MTKIKSWYRQSSSIKTFDFNFSFIPLVEQESSFFSLKMFQFAKFFVFCLAALQVSALTGGRNSNVGEYPAFVGIVLPFDTQVCGGSIFNRNHVLTVASCMLSNNYMLLAPNQVSIISGANTINFALPRVQVQAIYVHPQYNPFTSANDIAVVRTQTDFNFPQVAAPLVAPIELSSRIGKKMLIECGFSDFYMFF